METKQLKSTDITCMAPEAKAVFIAGTFNDWNLKDIPMKRLKSGKWKASIELAPGSYEYKFIVDDNWCCSPSCEDESSCPQCVTNCHGTMNRTLEVS